MFLNFGIMSRNGAREDYDRVSFQTIHIIQLRDNPAPNVSGLDLAPNGIIPLEDLDRTTMEMLAPEPGPAPPPPRPPTPVFGRSHAILDILSPDQPKNSAAASEGSAFRTIPHST